MTHQDHCVPWAAAASHLDAHVPGPNSDQNVLVANGLYQCVEELLCHALLKLWTLGNLTNQPRQAAQTEQHIPGAVGHVYGAVKG